MLMGAASDDGLPAGSSLSYTWSKVSGPGTVVFASVNNPVTSATFSASGVYVLQLAASDGALTSTSTTTVWAEMPPTVNAGSDQTVALNATVNLAGTASDDNLPAGSALAYTWRTVTVPTGATVAFGTGTALSTTATGFTVAGNYVLAPGCQRHRLHYSRHSHDYCWQPQYSADGNGWCGAGVRVRDLAGQPDLHGGRIRMPVMS